MSKSDSPFFLPTGDELNLIRASTSIDSEVALDNFNIWLNHHDFKVDNLRKNQILPHVYDNLEEGSKRLLPLVYSNFRKHNIDHPVADQFLSYYRYTLFRNRMLRNELDILIEKLDEQKIPYFVTKGMAYISMFYKDFGARPTSDIDLVIDKSFVETFLTDREAEGWHSVIDWRLNPIRNSLVHAITLKKKHSEIDLHWRFAHYPIPDKWTDYIAGNLIEFDRLKTIPKEFHLIDTMVHGYKYNVVRPIRWVCDALKIIESGLLDWDLLIEYTKDCGVKTPIKEGLSFLRNENLASIPNEAITEITSSLSYPNTDKYFDRISKRSSQFHNVFDYSMFDSASKWDAFIKIYRHYRLIWNQTNNITLAINILLVFFEKIFLKRKVFLKKVRFGGP